MTFGRGLHSTYRSVLKQAKVDILTPAHPIARVLPIVPEQLTCGTFVHTLRKNHLKMRVQSFLTDITARETLATLRSGWVAEYEAGEMRMSDLTHLLAVTSRSQASRTFAACLWYRRHRIPATPFVSWCRFYLNLPQIVIHQDFVGTPDDMDVPVQRCCCKHSKDAWLDPTADHAIGCKQSTAHAVNRAHSMFRSCLARASREAGVGTEEEPACRSVLAGLFTPAQCRVLFPKRRTQDNKQVADWLQRTLEYVARLPTGVPRLQALVQCQQVVTNRDPHPDTPLDKKVNRDRVTGPSA